MSATLTTPIDPAQAAAWLRDLLTQLGEGADAVLTEVLAGRDVRALRVVGPLSERGERYALCGRVGRVMTALGSGPKWEWSLGTAALRGSPRGHNTVGREPTRAAADRALCLALQALGWSPVEVPTEEEAAVPPGPTPEQRQAHEAAEVALRAMVFAPPQGGGTLTISSEESGQMTVTYDALRVSVEPTGDPWLRLDVFTELSDVVVQVWPDAEGSVELVGPWGTLRARDIRMDTGPNEQALRQMEAWRLGRGRLGVRT